MTNEELRTRIIDAVRMNTGITYLNQYSAELLRIQMMQSPAALLAQGSYISLEHNPMFGREVIWTNPATNNNPVDELRYLFHELSHASGGTGRLNRSTFIRHNKGSANYCADEVVAETSASLLLKHFNIMTPEIEICTNRYVAGYTDRILLLDPVNCDAIISKAQEEAEKAKNYILENWLKDITILKEAA